MMNLEEALVNLYKYAWRVVHGYPSSLALLLSASDVHREYEKIRPADEPEMTPKEIANLSLERVKEVK